MGTESTNKNFFYRLIFGNIIDLDGDQPQELMLEQGSQKKISDGKNNYLLLLCGIKVNRKIYQPTEIEAELDIVELIEGASNQQKTTAPQFDDVSQLLLQRMVTLEVVMDGIADDVATNCYVYELIPQLQRDIHGTKMYVKLRIFSVDKLMTLNKYSKAYVARKLGSEILKPESMNFGTLSEKEPLIASDVTGMQHLMYTDGGVRMEFIQPYLVQYNESFYDFLVRTSNRCGEFLFFEDGKLVLGLPERKSEGDPEEESIVEISDYVTVTALERSADPLKISGYARDSVKNGKGAVQGTPDAKPTKEGETFPVLNMAAIPREKTGFPEDVFPMYASSNAELAQDDYIFPLYRGKFTDRRRELNYDGTPAQTALGRMMLFGKTMLGNELDAGLGLGVTFILDGVLNEAVPQALATLGIHSWNNLQATRYMDILKGKKDQYNEQKAVQFGTLNSEGWTTLSYYKDIHRHEEEQQRKIVCINMGTNFANVKLGQKIKVDGLDDTYVIIQIEQHSEEAWNRDYDRYDKVADDKYAGSRSLKIYAIPGYGGVKKQFIPPVQPVPVIRKVGPQTAFIADNEDPKFQGRVRIAFPWQPLNSPERGELRKVDIKLKAVEDYIETLRNKKQTLLDEATRASQFVEELKEYVKATKEDRTAQLEPRHTKLDQLEMEIAYLRRNSQPLADIEEKNAQAIKLNKELSEFVAAAKEHDAKTGKADYLDLEKDNTVIRKYKEIYDKKNKAYLKAKADLSRAESTQKETKRQSQKLQERVKLDVKAMATPWVRVVTPMASPGGGTFFRPQVGDEVMVNFENDNVERPYVIGSVFSKNNTTPDEKMYRQRGNELQGKEVTMMMMSRNGHHITFTDPDGGANFLTNLVSPGLGLWGSIAGSAFNNLLPGAKDLAGGIHIGDRYGIYEIDMKSHKRSIDIRSPFGTVEIDAFSGITISAPNGNVTIRGKNINLEAGNKINVTSGMNIQDPGLGDPEGKKYKWGKALTDIFAEIIPTELNKYMFASIVDLSYIRHIVEVFVRPVDGTLKLKSKRYLMLEAGNGNATIRRDRYAKAVEEKKESQEEFYKALLTCVKFISEKVDLFYDTYETLWIDGYKKKTEYLEKAGWVLKDEKQPDLAEIASKANEWDDQKITQDTFESHFVETGILFREGAKHNQITTSPILKFDYIKDSARAFGESAFKMYQHMESFDRFLNDGSDLPLGKFQWMDKNFSVALIDLDEKILWAKGWKALYNDGNQHQLFNDLDPNPKADKFAMQNKTFHKRKLLLAFINEVAHSPQNVQNKYFECNLKMDYVMTTQSLRQEYYWNRMVFNLDRAEKYQRNNYKRKLRDSTAGIFLSTAKKIAVPFDRDIWNDAADGQILFSDQESKTLNFQGEGLHEESSSNIGTLDHLKKELMAIK
jgi:hypothetical protein